MNYDRIYHQLITAAINRTIPNTYTERHHIVPTSMGGLDIESNIVRLTIKEHYYAHILLAMSGQPNSYNQWASVAAIVQDTVNKSKPGRFCKLKPSKFIRRKLHFFATERLKAIAAQQRIKNAQIIRSKI